MTASAPAASIAGRRCGSRVVPRTRCPSAIRVRARSCPRQPQPTINVLAMTRQRVIGYEPPIAGIPCEQMRERARHPGLHDASGNELPHRLMEIQGVSTYVVDAGEGPTVVLIHGYGDTADGWRRIVPNLLRDHRVVALDVPPFGRSDDIKPPKLM